MWFYLCDREDMEGVVDSTNKKDGYLYPRPLETGYGEDPENKICIAPTIGQCMVSKPDETGRFFIYEIDVKDPIKPPSEANIADIDWSDEHWITDEIVNENHDGSIEVKCIGYVEISLDIKNTLKRLFCREQFPKGNPEEEKKFYKELSINIF